MHDSDLEDVFTKHNGARSRVRLAVGLRPPVNKPESNGREEDGVNEWGEDIIERANINLEIGDLNARLHCGQKRTVAKPPAVVKGKVSRKGKTLPLAPIAHGNPPCIILIDGAVALAVAL